MPDQASGLLSPLLRDGRFRAARPWLRGRVLDVGCGTGGLAQYVDSTQYAGIDTDEESLQTARLRYPLHSFISAARFADSDERFDTVVALATIEHVPDIVAFLVELKRRLRPGGKVVLTTPTPGFGRLYALGARLGIFSREAAKEHRQLLGKKTLEAAAAQAGLRTDEYRRFLLGANQLFVFSIATT